MKFADYSAVKTIIVTNPQLMFETWNGMSPLQYAFKVCDTYMWTLFRETLMTLLPKQLPFFYQQLQEQQTQINLNSLMNVYRTLLQVVLDPASSVQNINRAWFWHGKQLRRLLLGDGLPAHLLREFCRDGDAWGRGLLYHTAEEKPAPNNALVYCSGWPELVPLFPPARNAGLGFQFSLLRGGAGQRVGWRFSCAALTEITWQDYHKTVPHDIADDSAIFAGLYAARQKELLQLREAFACEFVSEQRLT